MDSEAVAWSDFHKSNDLYSISANLKLIVEALKSEHAPVCAGRLAEAQKLILEVASDSRVHDVIHLWFVIERLKQEKDEVNADKLIRASKLIVDVADRCRSNFDEEIGESMSEAIEGAVPELGDTVRDKVTGFEGVAIGVTDWLYNCKRITVQPKIQKDTKDGKLPDAASFDIDSLDVLEKATVKRSPPKANRPAEKTGGPQPEPTQQRDAH